jgi:gluconolactonase
VAGIFAGIFLGLPVACAVTFEIDDAAEFSKIIDTNAVLTTITNMNTWLEGPTWIPAGGYLVFCDQDNNLLKKFVPPNTVTNFLPIPPPTNTLYNGTLLDGQERLIAAEAGSAGLKISMITNGIVTPLVTMCNGLKFYSPNDVAVKSDGTIWFTDPGYNSGITKPHAGFAAGYYVYQFHPTNGNGTCRAVMTNGFGRTSGNPRPNGLCFSPDETKLYIADSDTSANGHRIYVYSVSPSNTLTGGASFAIISNGIPDGIKCDRDGRVWSSGGDGVAIFAANTGKLIGKIKFQLAVNLCFGGPYYQTLYIVGQPLVSSMPVLVAGTPALKKLQIVSTNGQVMLSWPAPSTGWALQETEQLVPTNSWTNSSLMAITNNNQITVSMVATNAAKFFRLKLN